MSKEHTTVLLDVKSTLRVLDVGCFSFNESPFICDNIERALDSYREEMRKEDYIKHKKAALAVLRHIDDLLEGWGTLQFWLYKKGFVDKLLYTELTPEERFKLYQTRLNWIDWLIEYWKDK